MKVHLVDGTYELFRHYYALPHQRNKKGEEIAAARGVVGSMLSLLKEGATHIAVATDHVIESFRNALWKDYKDGSGIEPDLFSQFGLLEDALGAAGLKVWPMVEYEADDALAAGAALSAYDKRVEQVIICTPDKDRSMEPACRALLSSNELVILRGTGRPCPGIVGARHAVPLRSLAGPEARPPNQRCSHAPFDRAQ